MERPYVIGGVIEDFGSTSHLQFDFLMGTEGLEFWNGEQQDWGASNYAIYVKIQEGVDIKALETKITHDVITNYFIPMMIKNGMPEGEVHKAFKEKNAHLELQPLREIHLHSTDVDDNLEHGDIRIVWLFGGIAFFVLLIAIINFVNLSTARSANRAKEIGLRKAIGSLRANIISQFLHESVLFSLISFVIGLAIAGMLLPFFNAISGKYISLPWNELWFLPTLLGVALAIGILAGIYPSFYLSAFKPIQVLKGNLTRGSKSSVMRSTLVVFQFTTSIILIVGTLVIYRQMDFIFNTKVGFDKEQVLLLQGTNTLEGQVVTFADALRALPAVAEVSTGAYLPVRGSKRNGNNFWNEGKRGIDRGVSGQFWRIDPYYLNVLGIKLVEGRNFNLDFTSDSTSIIINKKMEKELGGNMLGKRITNYAGLWTVVGVVEDFHFESLREDIQPLGMVLGFEASVLAVKLKAGNMRDNLQAITNVWETFVPQQPIRYSFLDERYAAMYADVDRMSKILTSFTVLGIVVACLGLFALSAFMVEQRSKEISVRLILGASVKSVFNMLTWNFVKLVVVAFLIAAPVAWYLMNQWLQDYAYRIDVGWDIFAITGIVAILISILTISYQALRAAWINPVQNLRSE